MIRESCRWPTYPASDHYNPASGRFFNPEPQRVVRPLDAASAVAPMMFRRKDRFPPQPLPVIAPDFSPFRQPENQRGLFVCPIPTTDKTEQGAKKSSLKTFQAAFVLSARFTA